jgi:hypothetical protein
MVIIDFSEKQNIDNWVVVDDGVMGGLSQGKLQINEKGNGLFSGTISLENYGGFSSIRYDLETIEINDYYKLVLHLKGDGKRYQFRVKDELENYYSYISYFETNGKWEKIEIPFSELYPSFRGRKLRGSNFKGDLLSQVSILFGNKKAERFELEIKSIELQ